MTFEELGLSAELLEAVKHEGYETPTPIQEQAIGHVLAGSDLLGVAQTGTGKTAAFALPILQRLAETCAPPRARGRKARVLVLSPTRELATQISESFATYGRRTGLRQVVIYGGVSQHPQSKAVRDGVDIIVATPGRLMDLMDQKLVTLDGIDTLVVDEADRMLDMGFIRDIRKIVSKVPGKRQTLMFSATMPADIRQLADSILSNPVRVQVAAKNAAADTVEQSVYFVDKRNKPQLLNHIITEIGITRAIVFTRTKHGADKVAKHLSKAGIRAEAIHGDKSQNARQKALVNFKSNKPPVLVATDVAARGLDIDEVSHVINYDMPNVPETYVHRIGRTGRAGAAGIAVSFCDHDEREHLREIEKLLRKKTTVCSDHPKYEAVEPSRGPGNGSSGGNAQRRASRSDAAAPPQRKPHGEGPADGRHRSRRRKSAQSGQSSTPAPVAHTTGHAKSAKPAKPAAKAKSNSYTTMW